MRRLAFVPAPSRLELVNALRFPLVATPLFLLYLRYRFFAWQKYSINNKDHVDYAPEIWRLSAYITALFAAAACPLSLAKYGDWLWAEYQGLTIFTLFFWGSLCAWVLILHFALGKRADDRLRNELESISRGGTPKPTAGIPPWVEAWGWLNAAAFLLVLLLFGRVIMSLE